MNPLENLQDIHSPAEIGLWPLAYGWWILAILIVIAIVLTSKWLIAFYRVRKNKKWALQELNKLNEQAPNYAAQINQLLKRVAMAYFSNISVQKLHGSQWAEFLANALSDKQAEKLSPVIQDMQNSLYRKHEAEHTDQIEYKQLATTWINQALPPNKKTKQKLEQSYA
ncbi:DUF4381 domain-containing protein [Paraglaciecola aquimarina]|uniref:DUF4381 domain-containing protein n=1 Tax=Paraglaciecola algarum TaxID=3050085 RepID=A0ABS9DC92_9ALTE|nr:DUF4381 domain-containing protein [Paraglaciecola sp. G1-23]MCF2950359.1 DUF4381 domain-containing protein [Paraglaciecola sp. G1-23]